MDGGGGTGSGGGRDDDDSSWSSKSSSDCAEPNLEDWPTYGFATPFDFPRDLQNEEVSCTCHCKQGEEEEEGSGEVEEDEGAEDAIQVPHLQLFLIAEALENVDSGSGESWQGSWRRLWCRLPQAMVEEILLRLPARDQARLLVVCTTWRDMLSSPDLLRRSFLHAVKQVEHPVCSVHCSVLFRGGPCESGERTSLFQAPLFKTLDVDLAFLPQVFHSKYSRIIGRSPLGLVCIANYQGGQLHLCVLNPMTQEFQVVPSVAYSNVIAVLIVKQPVPGAQGSFKLCISDPVDDIHLDMVYNSLTGAWKRFKGSADSYLEMRASDRRDLPFAWNGRLYTLVQCTRPRLVELNTDVGQRYLWDLTLPFFGSNHLGDWIDDCFLAEHRGRLLCCRGGIWVLNDDRRNWIKLTGKCPSTLLPSDPLKQLTLRLKKGRVAGDLVVFFYELRTQRGKLIDCHVAYHMVRRCWQKVPWSIGVYNKFLEPSRILQL